ncbi:MAG: hypothetical protein OEY41_11750 [Acidimicrobiia bacterium]|nr:hypothetical protein [Acidimicrobiia bacterium]MDH5290661.1 hypothetical protein [Acidimicrobiia bacterium]
MTSAGVSGIPQHRPKLTRYHVAKVGEHDAAGLMAAAPGSEAPAAWSVFIRGASMNETLAASSSD